MPYQVRIVRAPFNVTPPQALLLWRSDWAAMQLCIFDANHLGVVRDGRVYDVSDVLAILKPQNWPLPRRDILIENLAEITAAISAQPPAGEGRPIAEVRFCSPVANVPKVIAAPVNYRAHVAEAAADPEMHAARHSLLIGDAGLFLKAASSVVGAGDGIAVRFPGRRTDHEVELAVVIGTECRNVAEANALDVVAGYCIGLDITIRGTEDRSFRKSIDSYTVLGPWLTTADEVPDPDSLRLELRVNGEQRQDSNTNQLVYGVRKLIAWASEWYTLYPGDVIVTGTPEGVGPIGPGDVIDASIASLGSIRVAVRADVP
jgi:2,4-diketo-3-deoxy-L-fuconate hydrolase